MKTINPLTEETRYVWMDGEYIIHFTVKANAEQYRTYHGGIVIPI